MIDWGGREAGVASRISIVASLLAHGRLPDLRRAAHEQPYSTLAVIWAPAARERTVLLNGPSSKSHASARSKRQLRRAAPQQSELQVKVCIGPGIRFAVPVGAAPRSIS